MNGVRGRKVAIACAVATAWFAACAFGVEWTPLGLTGGGAMFAPSISGADSNTMMLSCDMGASYITHDAGRTWRMLPYDVMSTNLRCRAGFHPTDRNVIFAASGGWGKLMVSRDAGATWQPLGNLPAGL